MMRSEHNQVKIEVIAVPEYLGDPIASNPRFFAQLIKDIKEYQPDQIIFTLFGECQDQRSFFAAMDLTVERLTLLLGKENINIPCIFDKSFLAEANYDSSKLLHCYSQIHRITADQYPRARVRFTTLDNDMNTLTALINFYSAPDNLLLTPKSVTQRFRLCCNGNILQTCQSQGKGNVDFKYKTTILEMLKCAEINIEDFSQNTLKHNMCAAFSGEENMFRIEKLKKFILQQEAETANYATFARFIRFQPKFAAIPEVDEDTKKSTFKTTSSPPSS